MPGLIEKAQAQAATPEATQAKSVASAVPANLQDAFKRVVLAGQKVLYAKNMQPEIQKEMSGPGPSWKKLAEGVSKLMALLDLQSGRKLPREVIIPCALELLTDYSAFLKQSGKGALSDDELHQAMVYASAIIFKMYGGKDEDFARAIQQPQAAQPAAPVAQPTAPQGA